MAFIYFFQLIFFTTRSHILSVSMYRFNDIQHFLSIFVHFNPHVRLTHSDSRLAYVLLTGLLQGVRNHDSPPFPATCSTKQRLPYYITSTTDHVLLSIYTNSLARLHAIFLSRLPV